jgi:hypothetical protein
VGHRAAKDADSPAGLSVIEVFTDPFHQPWIDLMKGQVDNF